MLASLSANSRNLCVGLLSTLLVSPGFAAEAIGRVAETSGTVVRIKAAGAPELLGGGSPLATGDVIETQANSGAELRYDDGTVVRLAARSRFTVPEYRLAPQQAAEERFVSRLLAGAMRVVTGTIAKRQPRNARFVAHTATIGIRGTDFVVRLCDNDCVPAEGPTVARAGEELAGRVGGTAGDVSAIDARGRWRELPTSSALREGDQILTGATGIAVLVLRDGTRIALDPNSRLAIREFRYDEAAPRQGRITLELVDGKAQFASGQLAKQNPERFRFIVGEQSVRVHGTTVGAQRLRFPDDNPAPDNPLAAPPPELPKNPTLGMNGEVVLPNGRVLEARRDGSGQMRFFEKVDRGEPIGRLPDGSPLYADPAPGTDGSIEWRFELRGDQAVFVDVGNTEAPGATRSEPFAVPVGAALVQDGRLVFTADRPYHENEGSNERTDHATGSARQVASRYSLQTDPDGTVTTTAPPPPVTGSITLADGSRLVSGNPQALNSLVGEYLGARQAALSGPNPGTLAGPPGTGANTGDSIGAGGSRGRSGSRVGVTDGNVSVFSRYSDELRLARGETAGASDGKPPLKGEIPLTFATLSPDRIDVDRARFFGADATAGDNGKARNGVYVSVLEGAVGLAQGGAEVVLGQGETALAPVDGGPPLKVSRGARVTGTGALKLNIATGAPVCRPDESVPNRAAAPRGSPASAAAFDASRIRLSGGEIQGDPGKPKVNTSAPDSPGGKGKGFGPDFANRFSTMEEAARGKGLAGAGRLQGQQNLVGGRYADTFGGGRVNPDGDITLGGDLGGGVVTGRGEQASMFAAGKPVEGKETVFAPVPVTSGDNAGVSTGTASGTTMGGRGGTTFDTIVTGAPSKLPEIKPAADGRLGVIPSIRAVPVMVPIKRPVDDPQGGGSGVPLYVRSGQFGNEIRGVERAIGAKAGAAGGAGDGRTDQQAAGSGGGMMAQRNEQLGVVKDTSAGRINWDAALKINEVVNPGRQ